MKEPAILVVDDEAEMRNFVKDALASEGFTVAMAADGKDGIKQALNLRPDLILLDLRMPTVDGVTVCKTLRMYKETEAIPILVMTASLSQEQIEQAVTAGADDFVNKPVNVQDLLIRIRAMLKWKDISDPVERLSRYGETVREMTDAALPPPTHRGGPHSGPDQPPTSI